MSNLVNLNGVRKSFSLPLQALVAGILLLQLFFLFMVLYLRRDFHFELATITGVFGWIMFAVTIIFCAWNIISLLKRNSQLKKSESVEAKEQIFKSSTLVRYVTMTVIATTALVFALIWKDIYFFIYFVFSIIWQVLMFPSKTKIAMAVNYDVEQQQPEAPVETTPTEQTEPEQPQQDNEQL